MTPLSSKLVSSNGLLHLSCNSNCTGMEVCLLKTVVSSETGLM